MPLKNQSSDEAAIVINPYKMIADKCGFSEVTIRHALARKPIPYQTACRIAKHLGIDPNCFRIKADMRGHRKK